MSTDRTPTAISVRAGRALPAPAVPLLALALLLAPGCGKGTRTARPEVDAGLSSFLDGEPEPAEIAGDEEIVLENPDTGAVPDADLASLIEQRSAELSEALADNRGMAAAEEPQEVGAPDVSLETFLAERDVGAADDATQTSETTEAAAEPEPEPEPLGLDDLYASLDEALGRELASTSEPFRVAVVSIALAAGQGKDPSGAIAEGTAAGDALSPEERESALAIAGLLGSLLGEDAQAEDRAAVLRQFGEQLGKTVGLQIPTAKLCTRVRGFGKYEEFSSNAFLAGRPIRALVYVEVDQFEHGLVDTADLGGLDVEEQWSIELAQTLELYHAGESAMLAWRRPEEIVLETSRNRQRDFYLLTEITLPQTLTVGAYQLKITVTDRVGDQQASTLIPIKVVADPALAWTPN